MQDEEMFQTTAGEPRQAELVARACRDMEERIRSAGTRESARQIAESACREFDDACASSVLKGYLRKYADEQLQRYWRIRLRMEL